MFQPSRRRIPALPIALGVIVLALPTAHAQSSSGYAQTELSRIKTQSIGQGYSIDSINNITANSNRVYAAGFGVGNNVGYSTSALSSSTPTPRRAATFNSFGGGFTSSSKPFSNASSSPTISPYLNLFREGFDSEVDNYNTLVRPQLQQQRINQSLQRDTQAITRRVQTLAAKPAFNPEGSTSQSPTGHPTARMNYSHFYPTAGQAGAR